MKQGNISKASLKEDLRKYLDTDTLLYWEPLGSDLRLKQEEYWGAALQKFSTKMGMPALNITDDLFIVSQEEHIISEFEAFLNSLCEFQLASNQNILS